jgi:peroxiredoxin
MMRRVAALNPGSRAPEFSLAGTDGRTFSLSHQCEVPALLIFFKNGCPTCILAFPFLQRLYLRVREAPLRFWGISQDGEAETRIFGSQHGATFPLLPDGSDYPVSNAYGLTNVPTLFLVEPDGRIAWTTVGFSKTDLESLAAEFQRRFQLQGVTPLFASSDEVPALKPG